MTGYSPEYLTRLVQSGIVPGRQYGDAWFVSRYALEQHLSSKRLQTRFAFVEVQSDTLSDHMRAVQPSWLNGLAQTPLHEQLFALSVAAIVLLSSAAIANTNYFPRTEAHLAVALQSVVREAHLALLGVSSGAPTHAAGQYAAAAAATQTMQRDLNAGSAVRLPVFSVRERETAGLNAYWYEARGAQLLTVLGAAIPGLMARFDSPARAQSSLASAYFGMGDSLYALAHAMPGYYLAAVEQVGNRVYAGAVKTRDIVGEVPGAITASLTLLGSEVQAASYAAIRADVQLAYGTVIFAPSLVRAVVLGIGSIGTQMARVAAVAPYAARNLSLRIAAMPEHIGPALARGAFSLEYGVAKRFTDDVQAVASQYMTGIQTTAVALDSGITAVSSSMQQAVTEAQFAATQFAAFSRIALGRGVAASAAALDSFSAAVSVRP